MKVCFVGLENVPVLAREYNHHGIGGEQVQQTLLARALASRGYITNMVVGDYGQPDGTAWQGVETYKAYRIEAGLPMIRFVYPRWTGMWAAMKRADADVYYTSCAGMHVGLISMFCRKHGRGSVFRLASDTDADPAKLLIRYARDKWLYQYGLRRANSVLAQHGVQQRALMENYCVSSEVADMLVEPPASDLEYPNRDVDILWVSNLRELKRPDLALEVASRLPARHLHMIGGPQPGFTTLYSEIETKSQDFQNLSFHGRVPYHNVGDFFDRAKIFVNTSDTEGFPNTFLQAWRRGVPVVSFFDPDGLIEREGLGIAARSMDEMVRSVELLLNDANAWRETSIRCRAYMAKMHGDDVVLQPYIAAFQKADADRQLP